MAESETPLTPRGRFWFGLTFVAFGIMPMLATFDIGLLGTDDINGPPWLGLAAGGVFVAAGLAVMAGPERPVFNGILAILVIAGLAALGNWIAFGAGERVCAGSILFWKSDMSGLGCRIPFGMGALITNAILLLMVVVVLQKAMGGPPRLAGPRRWTENLLLLMLAPILLPVVLFLFARSGLEAVMTRLETGSWPRNEGFIARMKAKRAQGKKPE
ncbi:MAG: hypothetical protein KJ795_02810 [Gammaproteobacteria bacterium]|nr:hypothetical protein [Gammaproteobacteria bacterium]MBU1777519.1 hypothetical protein [Gammaproteobacteria bacterium]MBU1967699.1 hypothetical protein [Gammaproteobacteria bacterium]